MPRAWDTTVAVYSGATEIDHVVLAVDGDVCIGPPPARDSYMKFRASLLREIAGVDAITPRLGFLRKTRIRRDVRAATSRHRSPTSTTSDGDKAAPTHGRVDVPIIPGTPGRLKKRTGLDFAGSGFP